MKQLTTAIFGKLAGSALNTAIGGRLFKGRAPEATVYPYAVFYLVSDTPADTFTDKIDNVLVQFSLFSETPSSSEVEDLYTHLKTLYDDCSLTVAGRTVIWMVRENAMLMVEDDTTPAGAGQVWHYAVDYNIIEQR